MSADASSAFRRYIGPHHIHGWRPRTYTRPSFHWPGLRNPSQYRPLTCQQAPAFDLPFEEETLPGYEADQFYPVHIGAKLNSRYHVIGKLGFGASSTVWLCRDLRNNQYVALKVYVRTPPLLANREQVAYEHLSKLTTSHPGQKHVRRLLDHFSITQSNGFEYFCFVYQPLHTTLFDLQRFAGKARPLPEGLVREALRSLLQALDFLHTEASITHCDIKLSNLMLEIEDFSVLSAFEENERTHPAPRKVIDSERTIYASRKFRHPKGHPFGPLVLCDLGEARVGSSFPHTNIQPDLYKAPEILFMLDWNQSVDIWNVACVMWDMTQAEHLFDGRDEEGYHNNRVHIDEMVHLIGHPPVDFQRRSAQAWRVFDDEGKWKGNPPLSPRTLETRARTLLPDGKAELLEFMRSMLRWRPEDRPSARDLLEDRWSRGSD